MLHIPKNVPSPWYRLGCLNWEGDYPYAPDVQFRLWHDGEHLYIEYQVSERTVRALQDQPGQAVFKDSCVEFFIMPAPLTDRHYYNFEWNAGGVLYLACRTSRQDPEPAPPQVLASVRAESSLGPAPFPERPFEGTWTMKVTTGNSNQNITVFTKCSRCNDVQTMPTLEKCGCECVYHT